MSSGQPDIDWIAADWGTSHLRVWAMKDDEVMARASSDKGMGRLDRDGFEPALRAACDGWPLDRVPIVACGMVGSRQGWTEARYGIVPAPPLAPQFARPDSALAVHIIPGLSQDAPADVMRGEETQIAGLLAQEPGFDGVICLPGTHSKWAQISAGEVVSFRTAMTGELFDLLARQSILRHSATGDGWAAAAFEEAVADALSNPSDLAVRLFRIRAETLLLGLVPSAARARLSGLLIGAELAATKPYWLGQDVAIVGAEALSAHYETALALQGVTARRFDATEITLAGLTAAYRTLTGETS
jgi:2-dehydro-3-deoxygalactonokinase